MEHLNVPPQEHVKVLDGQGWVGLIDHLGTESTIVNAARVSFGKLKSEMDERDVKLLEYLIDNRHTSPLEHIVFTFSIHCPLFVRGQWHRHRTWSYNEISRRYTEIDMEFYTEKEIITILRAVHKYKDSREQFELRTHKRLIDIIKPSAKTVEALMSLELPAGVQIDIK